MKKEYLSFETERLDIRPSSQSDADFLFQLMNSPKWLKFIGDRKVHSVEDASNYIDNKITPQLEKLGYSNYTVIRKIDNVRVGTCGLYDRKGLEGIDIGFAFLPEYEKMGFAFESANKIKEAALAIFKIKKIVAITTKENIASQKLLTKLGLEFEGLITLENDVEELMFYKLEAEK